MKKALLIYIIILGGVYGAFTALDYKGVYTSERDIWKINDMLAKAARDPKIVPEATFGDIVNRYNQFIKKYPESNLAAVAHILIGRVYMIKNDYGKARLKYEEISQVYKDQPKIAVEAMADIGRTYALENNIPGVLNNYKRVIEEYPLTQIGMQAPVLRAKMYLNLGDAAKAEEAFVEAATHYRRLIKEHPDSKIEFNCLRSLGILYLASQQYRKAVDTFGKVLLKFPQKEYLNSKRVSNVVKTINTLSIVKLKDYDLPISIFNEFIKTHPDHKFNKALQEMIDSINILKENKVSLDTK